MDAPLEIVHCLRAPVGGLFRHVRDLVIASRQRGHHVAVICDSASVEPGVDEALDELRPHCSRGIVRVPMRREVGPRDIATAWAVARRIPPGTVIVHGHGAKGGAYARIAAALLRPTRGRLFSVYTPHGGSLHEDPGTLRGWLFGRAERWLAPLGDGILFESEFAARTFREHFGGPGTAVEVIHNGVGEAELAPIEPRADAADFVFVGELRVLKGVDTLLHALRDVPATAVIVGSGPDEADFRRTCTRLGLDDRVRFVGRRPARDAFALGKCVVVPSHAESLPYIVLEAAAASMPLVTTAVGGIPEIVGSLDIPLLPPADPQALGRTLRDVLSDPIRWRARAASLQRRIATEFRADTMAERVLAFYRAVMRASASERRRHARTRADQLDQSA